jgi:tRNA(Ile)-lysidine synthase
MRLLHSLATFLDEEAAVRPGDGIVVGFSGGADSTALLYGLTRLAPALGLELHAAHLDHALDAGSAERAAAAAASAARLGVACSVERRAVEAPRPGGAGLEAEARRARYDFLEDIRSRLGFRFVATAHHRDDQAETVLLRMAFGSGPLGLAAIERRRGAILRPLLDLGRAELHASLLAAGIDWIEDPTNRDGRPRNRIRRLLELDPGGLAGTRLAAIADRARAARAAVDRALALALDSRRESDGASASLSAMRRLPSTLVSPALAALHRQAGLSYPASRRAALEIERQMKCGGDPGCDCGRGFGWEVRGSRLHLARRTRAEPDPLLFTYTLALPGELEIKELSLRFRLFPAPEVPRDFEITPRRAALALPDELGGRLTVRNRRPGDRIRPLGWDTSCRVKDLLINRKVRRHERYRLPFVTSGENVIWIPGVTVDERYRATPGNPAWIAEIEDLRIAR